MTDLLIFKAILSPSSSSSVLYHQNQILQDNNNNNNNLYANIYDPNEYYDNYTSLSSDTNNIYYDFNLNTNNYYYNKKLINNKTSSFFINYDDSTNNLYSNKTIGKALLLLSPSLTILFAILSGLMSLITISGNILVITAFIIDKNLRSYSNYFILNLSLADLLIGLLIPPYAPFLLGNRRWVIGRAACTIWLVLDYVVGSASVLCIVVISLDRYLLVSKGLSYVSNQKVSKAICIMATVWIIAFLNYAPAIIFWELISGKSTVPEGDCQVEFHNNLAYLTATACVEFFVPLISICSLNLAVYLNIRKRSKGLIRSKNPQFCLANNVDNNKGNNKNNFQKLNVNKDSCITNFNNKTNDDVVIINKCVADTSIKFKTSPNKVIISITPSTSSASSDILPLNSSNIINNEYANATNSTQNSPFKNSNSKQCNNSLPLFDNCSQQKSTTTSGSLLSKDCEMKKTPPKEKKSKIHTSHSEKSTLIKINDVKRKSKKRSTLNSGKNSSNSLSKDKKAARSLFVLVFVFVCCWAPYTSSTLIKSVCPKCVDDTFYEFTFWLLWLNSTFNPILYPFLHVKFRKAFAKIICCCLKKPNFYKKTKSKQPGNNLNQVAHERNRLLTTTTTTTLLLKQSNNSPFKKSKLDV